MRSRAPSICARLSSGASSDAFVAASARTISLPAREASRATCDQK
jgi:hypothetical protein